jgi:hypothetical protein
VPTGSWAIRCRFFTYSIKVYLAGGLWVYRSTSGDFLTIAPYIRTVLATTPFADILHVSQWTDYTTAGTVYYTQNSDPVARGPYYLQLRYDGTLLYYDFSPDNAYYINIGSVNAVTCLGGAPTAYGVAANAPSVSTDAIVSWDWFRTYANANLNQ